MKNTSYVARVSKAQWWIALLALGSCPVWAGYRVIDDDLLPTATVEARQSSRAQALQDRYAIPFPRDRSVLNDANRAALDMLLPRMAVGATVRIVGRPDATTQSLGKADLLARARAHSIRDHLTRRGISPASVLVQVNTTPNAEYTVNTSSSDIYIQAAANRPREQYQTSVPQDVEEYLVSGAEAHQAAPLGPVDTGNERVIRFIKQALNSGQMDPAIAVSMLRSLAPSTPSYVPPPAQLVATRAAPHYPPSQPARQETNNTYQIRKSITLRENIAQWAKDQGLDLVWELPASIDPKFQKDSSFSAPTFKDAINIVVQGLHAKGYTFITANIYSDGVIQFTQK